MIFASCTVDLFLACDGKYDPKFYTVNNNKGVADSGPLKPSGIKTGRKKVAFSGDGRINRFDQSTWVVCCGGQETEGRNEIQMNKELRKAKCVPVRASRFYTRRI